MTRVTITAPREAWEALLRTLPRCVECGVLAEVKLGGLPRCCRCAVGHRGGQIQALPSATAAGAIVDALSPHLPCGRWEGGVDG